ncbi:MAG: hypothetical protein JJU00_12080 [Opitutales bacterium]|nr:hypothetical protein [Opitutales bacterium]
MMAEWRTYAVEDFIPFTPEVYFRMIERTNEAQWPLQFFALAGGATVVVLILSGRVRPALAVLSAAWFWSGGAFLIHRYADLNWAGVYFGWAYFAQGVILLGLAVAPWTPGGDRMARALDPRWLGLAVATGGVLLWPGITALAGGGWARAEVVGLLPDPTAVATLGILLMALKGWRLWAASVIPLLWCGVTALMLRVLEAPWAALPLASAVLVVAGMVWSAVARAPAAADD